MGVIVGELLEPARAGQVVDPAVAHVGEIEPARREPAEAERGAHPGALLVAEPEVEEVVVDVGKQLREDVGES